MLHMYRVSIKPIFFSFFRFFKAGCGKKQKLQFNFSSINTKASSIHLISIHLYLFTVEEGTPLCYKQTQYKMMVYTIRPFQLAAKLLPLNAQYLWHFSEKKKTNKHRKLNTKPCFSENTHSIFLTTPNWRILICLYILLHLNLRCIM